MKVLLICDDYHHPAQIPIDGTAPLEKCGFQFDIITNANDFSSHTFKSLLEKYPVVLLCKLDEISSADRQSWKNERIQKTFIDYVENGGGLTAVHSGIVQGKNTDALDRLIGCRFAGHPNECPVTVHAIKPHPVTEGVNPFCEVDEHYRVEIISPDADILLASYSAAQGEESKYKEEPYYNCPAAICPAGFVRTQGKGRICVLTPGHKLEVWHNVNFQRLLMNALNWCAYSEYRIS
ncbi:MAG: ThuA domain-containing protein [Treponema sp.]|nr:ThuA domain-containing protein [Treponema sp.]MCL2252495.1 ThuA domain-containing protein [Treponema sp.]